MLKLEDIKEYGRAWTVKELRRLLNYIYKYRRVLSDVLIIVEVLN